MNVKYVILLVGSVSQTSFVWLALEVFTLKISSVKLNVEMLSRKVHKSVMMEMM